MKTVTVILAGGRSSRMGTDKALLPVDGRPLLAVQAERWRGVFDEVVISADTRERFAALELGGARIVEDARPGADPMAALEAVMTAVPAHRYFLTAVDLPFGDPALALELERRMGNADACLIQREGRGWEPLGDYSEAMLQRRKELAASEQRHSLLPGSVGISTREYGTDLAVWCVLSVVLLLSPTLVRDRLRNTRPMQWASRRGRAILNTQMGAALLSALVLTAINLTVYAVPFLAQGPLQFAACGLGGFLGWGTPGLIGVTVPICWCSWTSSWPSPWGQPG